MSNPKSNRPQDKNPPDRSGSQDADRREGRKETTGSNSPGAEIKDRRGQQHTEWNQSQNDQTQPERSYSGNSERTGQQYSDSTEGNSSQRLDELNTPKRSQKKDQLDQSHGSELSQKESRQHTRGMNSPGMKNDQEMHRSVEKRNLTPKQDKKADLTDGEE